MRMHFFGHPPTKRYFILSLSKDERPRQRPARPSPGSLSLATLSRGAGEGFEARFGYLLLK